MRLLISYVIRRYEEVAAYLKHLASENPGFAELTSLGQSHEKRELYLLKIGTSPLGENATRAIWVDAGKHSKQFKCSVIQIIGL